MAAAKDGATGAQDGALTAQTTGGKGTGLALPASVLESLAAEAKEAAAAERPSVSRISLKSGVMSYGGQPMPNNSVEAVIVGSSFRNTYYAGRYDPNNIKNPNCFALSTSDEGMVPDPNVQEPENATCAGCPKNEWGSDPNGGRGKACKQTRRLVIMPANALADKDGNDTPDAVKAAELAVMDLPVTSVKNYSQYVNTLSVTAGVPAWAAIGKIQTVPDAKTQFKVLFQAMRVVPSVTLLDAIKTRREEAVRIALEPYRETETAGEDGGAAAPSGAAGATKKAAKF